MRALVLALAVTVAGHAQTPAPPAAPAANLAPRFFAALQGMGATNTASIVYVGKGMAAIPSASGALAAGPAPRYALMINYGLLTTRVELERPAAPKRLVQALVNDIAWDVADGKKAVRANAETVALRRLLLHMTPHGAIKAAFDPAGKRTMAVEKTADGKDVVTFTFVADKSVFKGYLDDQNMVTRVQTLPGDPVWGNILIEFTYSGYKDAEAFTAGTIPKGSNAASYQAIKAPARITQRINGNTVLDLSITDVRANGGAYVDVPEDVANAPLPK